MPPSLLQLVDRRDEDRSLLAAPLGRDVAGVERGDGVVRHGSPGLRAAAAGATLEEVLHLAVEALLPLLVGGRMAPAFLRARLLDDADVLELRRRRIVG